MEFDGSIFKTYDIRGTVPDQLTPEIAYGIGNALAGYLKPKAIAVGRDMRESSPAMFDALTSGIMDRGVDVVDLGMVSTDALYFAVGKYDYDGGVMITASHNPANYNGFKICRKNAVPLSGADGYDKIAEDMANDKAEKAPSRGSIARKDITEAFTEHALSFIDPTVIKPFNIVIDAGNGMGHVALNPVFDKLPCKITPLYYEPDGTFPNHPPNPIESKNLVDLQKVMKEKNADLGVAFDGDADRMFLLQKDGTPLGGDMVTALVADNILTKSPNETIIYNLICSRAVAKLVNKRGGTPIRTRVGHAIIKPLMKKHNAIFGGEHSGHFYFRDNWFADSGIIALLVCLELLSKSNRNLDEILEEINPYVRSGEINSRVVSIDEKIEKVAEAFSDAEIDRLDGLTVQYPDWWFNLRPSNTEPLLRLNVEADNKNILDKNVERLLQIIRS
ncbi:MAG: phosphomannomutase/phosphoglucomutase [candidate division Zixibacteria bacterium]|nr:phosphomannomutase/phosphoglucomutase [candidate division Zixibacteria bacterium]